MSPSDNEPDRQDEKKRKAERREAQKKARLGEALRVNLRRRREQAKLRAAGPGTQTAGKTPQCSGKSDD